MWEKCNLEKVEEVRKALEEGADPNTTDGERGIRCLMVALEKNQSEVVDLLISCPAIEVNAKDPINRTALHFACCHVEQAAGGARSLAQREDGQGQDSDHGGDKVWKA